MGAAPKPHPPADPRQRGSWGTECCPFFGSILARLGERNAGLFLPASGPAVGEASAPVGPVLTAVKSVKFVKERISEGLEGLWKRFSI